MSNEVIILSVGVGIGLACMALGCTLGVWLAYRVRNNISPLPQLPSLSRIIDIVTRSKKAKVVNHSPLKRMRS